MKFIEWWQDTGLSFRGGGSGLVYRRSLAVLLAALALCFAMVPVALNPISMFDEGFILTNASRMLAGDIPHRDYWAAYPPGAAAILAVFFKLLGATVGIARIVFLGWTVLLLSSTYALLRGLNDTLPAVLGTFLVGLLLLTVEPNHSVIAATALAITSLALSDRQRLGGIFGGSVVLFRHDFAGYLLIAGLVAWMLGAKNASYLRFFLVSASVALFIVLVVAGPENFFDQALWFPAMILREYRRLPIPSLYSPLENGWLYAWFVPVAAASVIGFAMSRKVLDSRLRLVSQVATFGLLLVIQAHSRLDAVHALPAQLFVSIAVIALGLCYLRGRPVEALALAGIVLISLASVAKSWGPAVTRIKQCAQQCFYNNEAQRATALFLKSNSEHGRPIFVGNTRHDILLANDASLYFMAKRQPAVRWNEMNPGIVTTKAVQEQIVKDLDSKQVRFAIAVAIAPSQEPNSSAISSGVYLLDNYLRARYELVASFGPYNVLERK